MTNKLVNIFKYIAIIVFCVTIMFVSYISQHIKYTDYKGVDYEYKNFIFKRR